MSDKNHFEFYGLPVQFYLDEKKLKKIFLENSRKYHPDHFTLGSEAEQESALALSAQNNQAYRILKNFDRRLAYILEIKGLLSEEGKNQLPQAFLFQMMEINEALMELEFKMDESRVGELKEKVKSLEKELLLSIQPILKNYSEKDTSKAGLEKVKEVYLKQKYLWRIKENLNRFAAASKEA